MTTVTGMDENLRFASYAAFYFGIHAARDPMSLKAIAQVSQRAYDDLRRTLHGIGTHPDKTMMLEDTHGSLHTVVTALEKVTTQKEFDALHANWCADRINFFKAHPHPTRKTFTLTYGQAQKWINMTLKYLAVLGHPTITHVYPYLHIPIDSIIYEEAAHPITGIAVPRPAGRTSWSRLNHKQYKNYQEQLRDSITHSDSSLTPLDWEAQTWITRSSRTNG